MSKNARVLIITIVVVLFGILLLTSISLFRQYKVLHQYGYFDVGRLHGLRFFRSHRELLGPPSVNEVDRIKPWMTFSYINTVFGMPNGYLQDVLHITDPRYPNLVIREVFDDQPFPPEFMSQLKAAVKRYLITTKKVQ